MVLFDRETTGAMNSGANKEKKAYNDELNSHTLRKHVVF